MEKNYLNKLYIKKIFSIFIFLLFTLSCSQEIENNENSNEMITIKVFSSLTCPHCANFHKKVVEKIKKKYVDSGKVQLIFMDFPLDIAALNASILLHCVDKKKQIQFLDVIYENQKVWAKGNNIDDINNNLKKIVKGLGISSGQFDKCLTNQKISDKILNFRIKANQKYSINSTPTIIINEKKLEGSVNFENIEKKIEKLI